MDHLSHSLSAVAFGVLLAFGLISLSTDNSARIPRRRIIWGALPGLVVFFLIWVVFSLLVALLALNLPVLRNLDPIGTWIFQASVGVATPSIVREIKNNWLGRSTGVVSRAVLVILQIIDEKSSLYFGRKIRQEERKADFEVFKDDDGSVTHAIDKLFEFHLVGIAQETARRCADERRKRVLGLFKVHDPHVKFKLLLRYLGYKDCLKSVQVVKEKPEVILRSWPKGEPDRRQGRDRSINSKGAPSQAMPPYGRRKSDSPYVQSFVLGEIGEEIPLDLKALPDKTRRRRKGSGSS